MNVVFGKTEKLGNTILPAFLFLVLEGTGVDGGTNHSPHVQDAKKGRWEMDRERKRGREGEAVRVGFHKFLEGMTSVIKPSPGSSRS